VVQEWSAGFAQHHMGCEAPRGLRGVLWVSLRIVDFSPYSNRIGAIQRNGELRKVRDGNLEK